MKSAGRRLRGHNFNAGARAGIVLRRICPQSPEVGPPVSPYYRCPEKIRSLRGSRQGGRQGNPARSPWRASLPVFFVWGLLSLETRRPRRVLRLAKPLGSVTYTTQCGCASPRCSPCRTPPPPVRTPFNHILTRSGPAVSGLPEKTFFGMVAHLLSQHPGFALSGRKSAATGRCNFHQSDARKCHASLCFAPVRRGYATFSLRPLEFGSAGHLKLR